MELAIKIKPHHFVDIMASFSKRKIVLEPHPVGHARHTVTQKILLDKHLVLEIEPGADAVCAPCSHNRDGKCDDKIDTSLRPKAPESKQKYNLMLDQRLMKRLKINPGDKITAQALCGLLEKNLLKLSEIYRELPRKLVSQREKDLRLGIKKYLGSKVKFTSKIENR